MAASFKYCVTKSNLSLVKLYLLTPFKSLLKDPSLEVKTQAFKSLTMICNQFPSIMKRFCTQDLMKIMDDTLKFEEKYIVKV